MMDLTETKRVYPLRPENMIGRDEELNLIREAYTAKEKSLLYFFAEGGTGKTRLLEEAFDQLMRLANRSYRCSRIIDLYQSEFHDPDNIQYEIAQHIDPKNRYFQEYRDRRKKYLNAKTEGGEGKPLADLAEKRDTQFIEDYQALAERERIALIFDTTENIQLEDDEVQRLCAIDAQSLVVKSWLIDRVSKFQNTVILLAGRPNPAVEQGILAGFAKENWKVTLYELKQLTEADADRYIQEILDQNPNNLPLDPPQKEVLFNASKGNPIRLALALQYIFQKGYDAFNKGLIKSKSLDGLLMGYLKDYGPPFGEIMKKMLLARKGMDKDLLKHLIGVSDQDAAQILTEMGKIIFVRPRKDGQLLFLHDALYDIFDQHYGRAEEVTQDYKLIAEYYEQKERESDSYMDRLENRVTRLYYELQWRTENGCRYFDQWEDEAIYMHMTDIDMRMNDEFLRYMHRYADPDSALFNAAIADQLDRPAINRASAVRWLERYTEQGQHMKAIQVANNIRNTEHPHFCWDKINDPLYKARLLSAWALNETYYVGHKEAVKARLQEAFTLLEGFNPNGKTEEWWKKRAQGTAYHNSGYFNRKNGFYAKAMSNYRRALTEFKKIHLDYMRGQTLTNYAYLLSEMGNSWPARVLIQEAIKIWIKLGMSYRLALAMNTQSLILCEEEKPRAGKTEAEKARNIFEHLDEKRGQVMAMIAIGRALRRLGNMWKRNLEEYPIEKAYIFLSEGENILLRSKDIAENLKDVLISWELYNELGSLYCDWAWLDRAQNLPLQASTHYMLSIENQQKALALAEEHAMPFQTTDSLVDLAQVCGDRCFFEFESNNRADFLKYLDDASACLKKAEDSVPEEYRKVEVTDPFKHEDGQPYWLLLGKVNLWRGVWAFRELEHYQKLSLGDNPEKVQKATECLLYSLAYLRLYGDDTPPLKRSLMYLTDFMRKIDATVEWMKIPISIVENALKSPGLLAFVLKDIQPVLEI